MHYYQFNIGDYASSTQHLDNDEDLAYRRMIDIYYSKESPLPKEVEKIARLIRMRTHSDCITVVLQEFFTLEKDGYHSKRIDKDILAFKGKSDKARASAQARWNKNKDLPDNKRNANASETHSDGNANHKPLTTNQEPDNKDLIVEPEVQRGNYSDDDLEVAKFMAKRIKAISKHAKTNVESWAGIIRKMRELDKINHSEICRVFNWANNDKFWQSNILSAKKLRDQFAKLDLESKKKSKAPENLMKKSSGRDWHKRDLGL